MNKETAAEFLGVSVRTLQRFVSQGHLNPSRIRVQRAGQAREELSFDESELQALKDNPPAKGAAPVPPAKGTSLAVTSARALSRQAQRTNRAPVAAGDPANVMAQAMHAQAVAVKILLTIDDCRTLTGLSRDALVEAIGDGRLKGGLVGRGYKVTRADLDAFITKRLYNVK